MNILFIIYVFVGFIVYEIPRVSVFGYHPLFYNLLVTTHLVYHNNTWHTS